MHSYSLFIKTLLQVSAFLTLVLCLVWPSIHVYSVSRILSRSRTHTVKTLPILKVPPCVLKSDLHLWHEPVMFWMKDKPCTFSVICTYYVSFSPCTKANVGTKMWLELVSYCTITNYYKTSDLKWHRYITLFFHRSRLTQVSKGWNHERCQQYCFPYPCLFQLLETASSFGSWSPLSIFKASTVISFWFLLLSSHLFLWLQSGKVFHFLGVTPNHICKVSLATYGNTFVSSRAWSRLDWHRFSLAFLHF